MRKKSRTMGAGKNHAALSRAARAVDQRVLSPERGENKALILLKLDSILEKEEAVWSVRGFMPANGAAPLRAIQEAS